jgi:hypothetical protein
VQTKIKKKEHVDSKKHIVSGKPTFNLYRQCNKKPKQPGKMADIETIDTRNREVNSLYSKKTNMVWRENKIWLTPRLPRLTEKKILKRFNRLAVG